MVLAPPDWRACQCKSFSVNMTNHITITSKIPLWYILNGISNPWHTHIQSRGKSSHTHKDIKTQARTHTGGNRAHTHSTQEQASAHAHTGRRQALAHIYRAGASTRTHRGQRACTHTAHRGQARTHTHTEQRQTLAHT